jgi:hypothetical protein
MNNNTYVNSLKDEDLIIVSRRVHTIESKDKKYETHILTVKRIEPDGRETAEFDLAYNNLYNIYVSKNEIDNDQVYHYNIKDSDNKYTIPQGVTQVTVKRCEVKKDPESKKYKKVVDPLEDGTEFINYLHKIVLFSFDGRPNLNLQVDHKDGNTYNNAYSNLQYLRPTHNAFKAIAARDKVIAKEVYDMFMSKVNSGEIKDFHGLIVTLNTDYLTNFVNNSEKNKGGLVYNLDNFIGSLVTEDIIKNTMNFPNTLNLIKECDQFLKDKED